MRKLLFSVTSTLLLFVNPFLLVQVFRQGFGQLAACIRHLHSRQPPASVHAALPFEGRWIIARGGLRRASSHSWGVLAQRFALDLIRLDEDGRQCDGDGRKPSDYFSFGAPVLAPVAGTVVQVHDGEADQPMALLTLPLRTRDLRGNHVVLRDASGVHCVLAHLKKDSITVARGEQVTARQRIGECGNSGFTTQPHLHLHFQTTSSFYSSLGVPVFFDATPASGEFLRDYGQDEALASGVEGTLPRMADLLSTAFTVAVNLVVAWSVWYWIVSLVRHLTRHFFGG